MNRFHVHVSVADLNESVGFYSTLFAAPPTVLKTDYGADIAPRAAQAAAAGESCCAPAVAPATSCCGGAKA
jgi:hypothetical protein